MRQRFDLPEKTIVDIESGYAINVPVEDQLPPNWWRDPELASRIMSMRKENDIELHDALWSWLNGNRAS